MDNPVLCFKVLKDGKNSSEMVTPRWQEATVDGGNCPVCGETMVVVVSYNKKTKQNWLYAFCVKDKKAFIVQ